MAQMKKKGITVSGSLKKDNVTMYTRCGKIIMRTSTSDMPLQRTRSQFVNRQRVAHSTNLWKALRASGNPLFAGSRTAYARFNSLMCKMPRVFMTKEEYRNYGALLLPGMPVSDGILPDIGYTWGEAGGLPALVTTVRVWRPLPTAACGTDMVRALCYPNEDWREGDGLRLYTLVQKVENMVPKVYVTMEEAWLNHGDSEWGFAELAPRRVGNQLALAGSAIDDPTRGWALVHTRGESSSSQGVLTRSTLYEQYMTEEALLRAAESYGGLTEAPFITPG